MVDEIKSFIPRIVVFGLVQELQAMLEKSELQPVYSFPAPATSPLHRDDSRVDFFSCKSLKAVSSNILNSCSSFHGSGPVSWDTNEGIIGRYLVIVDIFRYSFYIS